MTANTVQYAAGLAATLPLALLWEDHAVDWSVPLGLSLLYLIVCNSLIALTLLLLMIRRGEVSRVSALFFLVPPVAALIGRVLLDEQMPSRAWLGLGWRREPNRQKYSLVNFSSRSPEHCGGRPIS